jgi:CheY-like chemotaxis protein
MDGHDVKILVAEDHESNRNLLALMLKQAQYEVHVAADGYEALNHMLKEGFDAVITDWEMPRLNGSDFLSLSRILWPDTPVIIVSAYAAPSLGGIPGGAFAWLIKPYELQELLQILQTALQITAHRKETGRVISATI